MPRFFINEEAVCGDMITVTGTDAVHIGRSLRMKTGDGITFVREGKEHLCTIEKMTSDSVICRVNEIKASESEPVLKLTVYQALPKQDKAELIIQKCTELGADEFVFFISERCVSRPDDKSADKKIQRYRKIAEEAAKQSGRGKIPDVRGIYTFKEAAADLAQRDIPLICYENGGKRLKEIEFFLSGEDRITRSVGVMIGAEGGFERGETDYVCSLGAIPVWLGSRILRCETCPIAVTSVLMNMGNEM